MKKIVLKLVIASIAIIFLLLAGGIIVKALKSTERADRIKKLPSFSIPTIEGNMFNSDDLPEGPLLIIYFHPECEHCRYEISSLLEGDIFSKVVMVLLVSNASPESIKMFMRQFEFSDKDFRILTDSKLVFNEIFGIDIIPSTLIYNKNLELVKFQKGEVKMEAILKYLDSGN